MPITGIVTISFRTKTAIMLETHEREDEDREMDDEFEEEDGFEEQTLETELEDDLIEEWCPNCKEIKPHAIVNGDKIACAACNHEHRRETEFPATPVVQKIVSAEDLATDETRIAAWERLTGGEDLNVQPYSIRLKLAEGDIISHTKFGLGIVVEMTDTTKAEVLFRDGMRRLVCGK